MSGFSADWLALREPIDLAARNNVVEAAFCAALPSGPVRLQDLASGAGSTVVALSRLLKSRQEWHLCDHDPILLDVALRRFESSANLDVNIRQIDLSTELDHLKFDEVDGITTSAFLDLVTEGFLGDLVDAVTRSGKPFLASLTYDGRAMCSPDDCMDEDIRLAMNAHQKTDKGFGAALGPDAAMVAESRFNAAGYRVVSGTSDWRATVGAKAFQNQLIAGWLSAGRAMGLEAAALDKWHERRRGEIDDGILEITVGHVDFAAIPL